ncbi:MAG: hypothetical protein ACP5M7_10485 [Thermoproteota archaeon]
MDLVEFTKFVLVNPDYKFKGRLKKIAEAVKDMVARNEVPSFASVANAANLSISDVRKAVTEFYPEEVKQINIEKAKAKAFAPPTPERQRGDLAQKQVEMALGDAYVTGVKQLASKYNWFGEVITDIGEIAFMGYLMSVNIGPDEINQFLSMFKDPKELVAAFQDYYTYLLKFSTRASEMQTIIQELNEYKEAFKYIKEIFAQYREALASQQRLNAVLSAVIPKEKLEQAISAWALTNVPIIPTEEKKEEVEA